MGALDMAFARAAAGLFFKHRFGILVRNIPRSLSVFHAEQDSLVWVENQRECNRSENAW